MVQNPRKTTAMNSSKQAGAVTTVERSILVTMALAVSANGLFTSRKISKRHFRSNVPEGSSGTTNESGWMTEQDFQSYMRHFIKHVRVTKERPVLLILDNHQSHLDLPTLDLAEDNGVILLSFQIIYL
ncbi:hypothetical protein AVEN_46134-1 [Araneus ventricosus]|uniref:DDE-1 domain-containing protein n=1 Tax=Araneus ventricosus TaxID=182803 RepID=A0A4Y2D9T0_ARAVE|nr:hypothetical protein AVEN_46134-1 [Araneus ventricosus]